MCADPISHFEAGILNAPTALALAREGLGKSTAVRRMLLGGAAFGQIPLILGDQKPDYVRLIQLLGGEVVVLGRGRAYLNPLDVQMIIDAIERVRAAPDPDAALAVRLLPGLELPSVEDPREAVDLVRAKRRAMESELWADARGKRHTMLAGLCNIRRGQPLRDVEDAVLAAALAELDETYVGEPTFVDVMKVIEDRPVRLQEAAYDEGSEERYRETVRPLIRTIRALLEPHGEMAACSRTAQPRGSTSSGPRALTQARSPRIRSSSSPRR